MRGWVIFLYYSLIVLALAAAFLLGDFGGTTATMRLLLLFFFLLLVFNPIAFIWGRKSDLERAGGAMALLQASASDLENKVKNEETKLKELEAANQRLEELDRTKSQFVSLTTHQLRTPLSAIKWTFHMLLNGDMGPVTEEQRTFLKKGYDSAERVITVINDWLNLDYLEAHKSKLTRVPVNINELVDSVIFEFTERVREKRIEIVVERSQSNLPPVAVDPIKFSMVIENLVDNALKYTPAGGKVTVRINDDKVTTAEKRLEIVVADTGIGIPEAERGRIFERFFRASNATKLAPRGSGLGLSIVRDIVTEHGGEVRFENPPAGGTRFIVSIPVA